MKTLEIDISFGRDYLTHHFGLAFERDYFEVAAVRIRTDQDVRRCLWRRFGDVGLGEPRPAAVLRLGYDDTLNVTLMFGGELMYSAGVTWVQPGFLPTQAIDRITCPPVERSRPHRSFLEQFDQAAELCGPGGIRPPAPHGILEAALDMCGDAFLSDMLLCPERCERLLDVLTETIIAVKEFWDVKCFGRVRKGLSLGGCSTCMLSPQLVARMLVPRYQRIAQRFQDAFMCSCGVSTHNLENFAGIDGLRYVRVGWGTDLAKTAAVLGHKHVKAALSVVRAAALAPGEFAGDVDHVLASLMPVDNVSLLLIHCGRETPDANIRAAVERSMAFARRHGVELRDTPTCRLTALR